MSKHTDGDWELGPTYAARLNAYDVYIVPVSAGGKAIAGVYCGTPGRPRNVDEELANAELIASAPVLLETVQGYREMVQLVLDNWSSGDLAGAVNALEEYRDNEQAVAAVIASRCAKAGVK